MTAIYMGTVSKYHNRRTTVDNIEFASKREADRYVELKLLGKKRVIEKLTLQPEFILLEPLRGIHRGIKYIADFSYYDNEKGQIVVEDCKGMRTKEYILKKKLFLSKFSEEYIFLEV